MMVRVKTKVGDRRGSMTVLDKLPSQTMVHPSGSSTRSFWRVRCDCGFEFSIAGTNLKKVMRCKACAYRARPQSARRFSDTERLFRLSVVGSAKKRGIAVEIDAAFFMRIASMPCAYCGDQPKPRKFLHAITPVHVEARNELTAHGLDRVDSAKGYSEDNCVSCCKTCNAMKLALPVDAFIAHIRKIHRHLSEKP